MPPAMYPDQRDLFRVYSLQFLAMPYRDQPVSCTMDDISMAFYFRQPLIRTQMISQYKPYRQDGQKSFGDFQKTIIRCIQDQKSRIVIGSQFCRESAADTATVYNHMLFIIRPCKRLINKLHIGQHFLFTAWPGAFPESAVVNKYYVIIVTIKITGIFRPALNAAGITMKIENKSCGIFPVEMQRVYTHALLDIEEIFFERDIIPELEISF